jgi:hypothetical protein
MNEPGMNVAGLVTVKPATESESYALWNHTLGFISFGFTTSVFTSSCGFERVNLEIPHEATVADSLKEFKLGMAEAAMSTRVANFSYGI